MSDANPIELLFGGMEKLGPGSDRDTRHALGLLPEAPLETIVDAGCGTGRQTLTLAKARKTVVHAVDSYEPFLSDLARRAGEEGVGHLVRTHCLDMADIPKVFSRIDLLSESRVME